jgi:hypothetical protein
MPAGPIRGEHGHPIVPLSVLDLSPITEGGDAGQALRNSLDLVRWGPSRPFEFQHSFDLVLSDLQRL